MVKNINIKKTAISILENNQYMVLGTAGRDGYAWVSPVVYAFDKEWNLYFMSKPTSRHGRNISENSKLSVAIFDSHCLLWEGVGLQIEAKVKIVPAYEMGKAMRIYLTRKWPYGKMIDGNIFIKLFRAYKYRLYKVVPMQIWMNDPRREEDRRVKVRGLS